MKKIKRDGNYRIEKINHYRGVMSKAQKRRFFKFIIGVYQGDIEIIDNSEAEIYTTNEVKQLGFCYMFRYYFNSSNSLLFEEIPELNKYRPEVYYDCYNDKTDSTDQFWFPLGDDQSQRIEICNKMLKELR